MTLVRNHEAEFLSANGNFCRITAAKETFLGMFDLVKGTWLITGRLALYYLFVYSIKRDTYLSPRP